MKPPAVAESPAGAGPAGAGEVSCKGAGLSANRLIYCMERKGAKKTLFKKPFVSS